MSPLLAAITIDNLFILGALVFLFGLLIGYWFRPQPMDDVAEYEEELARIREDRDALQRRLGELESHLQTLSPEDAIHQARSEVSSLRTMLDQEFEARGAAEEAVERLREHVQALEAQLREAGAHAQEHERQRNMQQQTSLQFSQLQKEHAHLLHASSEADQTRSALEVRLRDTEQRNAELCEQLEEMAQRVDHERDQRTAADSRARLREAEVEQLQIEAERLHQTLEQARGEFESMLRSRQEEANQLRGHMTAIRAEMSKELQELRNRLQRETVERAEWEQAARERQEETERLRRTVEERDAAFGDQDAALEQLRAECATWQQERNQFQEELSTERRARKIADAAIGERVSEIDRLTQEVSAVERDLKAERAARHQDELEWSMKLQEIEQQRAADAQSRREAAELAQAKQAELEQMQLQLDRLAAERDRRRQDVTHIEERMKQLQHNCEEAHTSLRQERDARQKADLKCEAAMAEVKHHADETEALRARLAGLETRLDGAHDDLRRVSLEREQARQMAASRQEAFQQTSQQAEQLVQELENFRAQSATGKAQWEQELARMRDALLSRERQIEEKTHALTQREDDLSQLQGECERLMRQAERVEMLEQQAGQLGEVSVELEQVRETYAASQQEAIRLGRERDEALANALAVGEQLQSTQQLLQQREDQLHSLNQAHELMRGEMQKQLQEHSVLGEQMQTLRDHLQEQADAVRTQDQLIDQWRQERAAAAQREKQRQQERQDAEAALRAMQDRLENKEGLLELRRSEAAKLQQERDRALDQLRREAVLRGEAESRLQAAQRELQARNDAGKQHAHEAESLRQELDRARQQFLEAEQRQHAAEGALQNVRPTLQELQQALASLHDDHQRHRQQLEEREQQRQAAIRRMEQERDLAATQMLQERRARLALEASLTSASAASGSTAPITKDGSLRRHGASGSPAYAESREALLQGIEQHKRQLESELQESLRTGSQIQDVLDATLMEIRRLQQEAEKVRTELTARPTPTTMPVVEVDVPRSEEINDQVRIDPTHPSSLESDTPSMHPPAPHGMRDDPQYGWIFASTPPHRNDLTRIKGISSAIEEKLNSLGVFTYEQIMNWRDAQIDAFSRMFSFRTRIQRDDWVGQAAEKVRRMEIQHRLGSEEPASPEQRRSA